MISLKNRLMIISVILYTNVKYSSSENKQCENEIEAYLKEGSVKLNYIHAFENLSIGFIQKLSNPGHLEAYFKEMEDMVDVIGVSMALNPVSWCINYQVSVAEEICLGALKVFNFITTGNVIANSVEILKKDAITAAGAYKVLYLNWRRADLTLNNLFPKGSDSKNTVNKVDDSKTNKDKQEEIKKTKADGGSSPKKVDSDKNNTEKKKEDDKGSKKTEKKDDGKVNLAQKQLEIAIAYFDYHLGWSKTAKIKCQETVNDVQQEIDEVEDKKKVKTIQEFCNEISTAAEPAPVF